MNISTGNDSDCGKWTADFQIYLFPITYTLVMVFGLLGNCGALYYFIFKMEQKSPSTVYIISRAVTDTMFLCILPFRIHYHINHNNWVFGKVACRLVGTVFFGNIYISIAFMSCICVDRYMATIHPHTYLRLRNTRCAMLICTFVWVISGVAILAFILTSRLDMETNGERTSCFENFSEAEWKNSLVQYSIFCLIFGALVPFLIILVLYPLVARRIRRIRTSTAQGALRIIYTILAITVFCFLPFHLVYLLHLLRRIGVIQSCSVGHGIYKARRVTMALISMNSLLDPVIYYFATKRCKWSFKWLKPRRRQGVYVISEYAPSH